MSYRRESQNVGDNIQLKGANGTPHAAIERASNSPNRETAIVGSVLLHKREAPLLFQDSVAASTLRRGGSIQAGVALSYTL